MVRLKSELTARNNLSLKMLILHDVFSFSRRQPVQWHRTTMRSGSMLTIIPWGLYIGSWSRFLRWKIEYSIYNIINLVLPNRYNLSASLCCVHARGRSYNIRQNLRHLRNCLSFMSVYVIGLGDEHSRIYRSKPRGTNYLLFKYWSGLVGRTSSSFRRDRKYLARAHDNRSTQPP